LFFKKEACVKRLFDFVLALLLLVPVTIFVTILSLLIWLVDGYSPFYPQQRLGRNGRAFWCFKLQTMRPAAQVSEIGEREKDVTRITRLGSIIRDHCWDELPQIINVLIGVMSFAGPRPLLPKTYERIEVKNPRIGDRILEWRISRQLVPPGVSGWHQVQIGRRVSMIDCDLEYLSEPSFSKNLRIALTTFWVFFLGKARYNNKAG
jgi:lipopolysaccharide/colanic/teichoic acid biosynthesis glycosyltransferase